MAKKQVYKNNTYAWVDDKISKLSIVENENPDNGFVLLTKEDEEEEIVSPPPRQNFYKNMNPLATDKNSEFCTSRSCNGVIDSYGFCSKCNKYEHSAGMYECY